MRPGELSDQAAPAERPDWVKCALVGVVTHSGPDPTPTREERAEHQRTWCGRVAPEHEWVFVNASHAALNAKRGGRMVLCPGCTVAIVQALWQALPEGEPIKVTSPAVRHIVDALASKSSGDYELLRAFLIEKVGYEDFCRLQEQAFALRFGASAQTTEASS